MVLVRMPGPVGSVLFLFFSSASAGPAATELASSPILLPPLQFFFCRGVFEGIKVPARYDRICDVCVWSVKW